MVNLDILSKQLLLARLLSQVPPDLVAVLFSLEEGDQVDAGPHLLAGEFTRNLLVSRQK